MANKKLSEQQVKVLLAMYKGQQPALVVANYMFTTARSLKSMGLAYLNGVRRDGPYILSKAGRELAARYCEDHLRLDCQECKPE